MKLSCLGLLAPAVATAALAADHGDTPRLIGNNRHDARITDLHVFTSGSNLVLSLCTNPNVPVTATSYTFPADLTLRFHIDNHSAVSFEDPIANATYGGTVARPDHMGANIVLEVTFDDLGRPHVESTGLSAEAEESMRVFAGLRDDPFIRKARNGRNVGAVVIELPLAHVFGTSSTILVWATSKVPGIVDAAGEKVTSPIYDLAGRAIRSQEPGIDPAVDVNTKNETSPHKYWRELGLRPDVLILDYTKPVGFPNGRLLTDDVVDLVALVPDPAGRADIRGGDAPLFPTQNDEPFLAEFPYLAAPH